MTDLKILLVSFAVAYRSSLSSTLFIPIMWTLNCWYILRTDRVLFLLYVLRKISSIETQTALTHNLFRVSRILDDMLRQTLHSKKICWVLSGPDLQNLQPSLSNRLLSLLTGPKRFNIGKNLIEREDFDFKNSRGFILKCSIFTLSSEKNRLPCVLFLHGLGGCRLQGLQTIDHLLENNIIVFKYYKIFILFYNFLFPFVF